MTHRHFIMHKPYGYLCQFVCELKKKKLVGDLFDFPIGTMAIGRLDEESEGLLLLTTDGMVSELVRSKKTEKEYYAQVDGLITNEAILNISNTYFNTFLKLKYVLEMLSIRQNHVRYLRLMWIRVFLIEPEN